MAGALRELVAMFGVEFDGRGAKRADKALDNLGGKAAMATPQVNHLGRAIAGIGLVLGAREVGRFFTGLVTKASDANETLNVLEASFGGATKGVLEFSAATAKEVGRSEFQIRQFAGQIGALVAPAFKSMGAEGERAAAGISTDFAKLAVDLSSFFNTTEDEALTALRAGVSGESEPLKRFGVDLTEAGIADALGISGPSLRKMSRADKMMARYRAVMIQTANAQGDAARTGEGFANASRALSASVSDIATRIGMKLLPTVEKTIRGLRNFAATVQRAIQTTDILDHAGRVLAITFGLLGTAALWAGRAAIATWIKAAVPFLAAAAAAMLVGLAIDDLLTTMEGGESVFGKFLEWVTDFEGAGGVFRHTAEQMAGALMDLFSGGGPALTDFVNAWIEGADIIYQKIVGAFSAAAQAAKDAIMSIIPDGPIGDLIRKAINSDVASKVGSIAANMIPGVPMMSMAGDALGALSNQAVRSPQGARNYVQSTEQISITVNGGSSPASDIGRETERAARKALRDRDRRVSQSVGG